MKLTDKRFLIWRILIVLLIIVFLIAIVVLFKSAFATDSDTEKIEKEELFKEVFQSLIVSVQIPIASILFIRLHLIR